MKSSLRILFATNSLGVRAGSELLILDLAIEFRRRGHRPVVYSSTHGAVAEALRQACIPVLSDLDALGEKPDIIHGQHHIEAMTAMLHFPEAPAVYACLGWLPWEARPPQFLNIRKYIAVGALTRESIVTTCGIAPDEVAIVSNFVDLQKFQLKPRFSDKPKSALIFDNNVAVNSGYAETVRLACQRAGIERIGIVGAAANRQVDEPQKILAEYDIVFAVGRSALEAMSVGCSVILASPLGAYGMIAPDNVDSMFGKFGLTSLDNARLDTNFLQAEIVKHSASNALAVAQRIREKADLRDAADRYEAIYREAIAGWAELPPSEALTIARLRDAARYVASLKPLIRQDRLKQEILQRQSLLSQLKNQGVTLGTTAQPGP